MNHAPVALAPDRDGLYPFGPVLGRVLFIEEFFVNAVGIPLARECAPSQVWNDRRSYAHVVVDNLLLGETNGRVENFLQIRQLELFSLYLDRRVHGTRSSRHCARNQGDRKIQVYPYAETQGCFKGRFDNFPARHVISNFCPSDSSKHGHPNRSTSDVRPTWRSDEDSHFKVSRITHALLCDCNGPGCRVV